MSVSRLVDLLAVLAWAAGFVLLARLGESGIPPFLLAAALLGLAWAQSPSSPGLREAGALFALAVPFVHTNSRMDGPGFQAPSTWGWFAALGIASLVRRSWVALALGLALLVVYFSGSAGGPDPMREWLARFLRPEQIEPTVFGLRKLVHFTFYFSLSAAAWLAFRRESPARTMPRGWYAFVFAVSIAIFDEATQSASALRSGKVWDVVLDAVGALTAILILEARVRDETKPR